MFLEFASIPIYFLRIGTIWKPTIENKTLLLLYNTFYTYLVRHLFIHIPIVSTIVFIATESDFDVILAKKIFFYNTS